MASVTSRSVLLVLTLIFTAVIETKGIDLTPRRFNTNLVSCTTINGNSGKCVDWSQCNENYQIGTGGIVPESDLRSQACMTGEWCCSNKNVVTDPLLRTGASDSPSKCIVTERPDCPWCVKLYRNGKDRRRLQSGFFCMGTLISNNVILTTGTCVIQAQSQDMWARIPSSPNPNSNYTVNFRLIHPGYNSGTRENDLALLRVLPVPELDKNDPKGACLGLAESALEGDCIAAGIDEVEKIRMTPLIVTKGNCGSGSVSDSSCGHAIGESCSIVHGSPIMCRENDSPFMMTGLAKAPCINDPPQSLLNNLFRAKQWLNDSLKGENLTEADYIK